MKQYYKLTITETGRDTLKDEPYFFNEDVSQYRTLEAVKTALQDRYGKIPRIQKDRLVYVDSNEGQAIPVGFTCSYWNKDYSHVSKSWYQTDWITIAVCTEEPVDLAFLNGK